MKRGYVVTWDSTIALSFILFILLGFIGLQYSANRGRGTSTFERLFSVAENALDTADRMGAMEAIGYLWAGGNLSQAANLTRDTFDVLISKQIGYRLEVVDADGVHVIYDSNESRRRERDSSDKTNAFRIVSGYEEDEPRGGWTARAWLEDNRGWMSDRISNKSTCCDGLTEKQVIQYYPGDTEGNIFYVIVPGYTSLTSASFNVSWVEDLSVTTSTTTTVTTTATTTSTTTTLGCHTCPPPPECEIPGWFSTVLDDYNYHSFTLDVPSGESCDLEVIIYREPGDVPGVGFIPSMYDAYANWFTDQCQEPEDWPNMAPWDCSTYLLPDDWEEKSCFAENLPAGTYDVMVDCYSPQPTPNLCPGGYYIYLQSYGDSDPACPNYSPPTTSSTTTTTTITTTTTTLFKKEDGQPCSTDGECASDNCARDYDGVGMWCAPSGNCVHSTAETCDAACYGYAFSDHGPDCSDTSKVWVCDNGVWYPTDCSVCGGAEPKDVPCTGRWKCQPRLDGATCDGGCTKDDTACDYCGSTTRGYAGSDTWYDAVCNIGICVSPGPTDCPVCESCRIVSYAGSCSPIFGINNYLLSVPDEVDPNTCITDHYCDGTGQCILAPISSCSPKPKEMIYNTGVCSFDPPNCLDDGVEYEHPDQDGNTVRLSYREYYYPGDGYLPGWYDDISESGLMHQWRQGTRYDDDISIGTNSFLAHHGTSVKFKADVADGIDTMLLHFSVMPEGNCPENVTLYDATEANLIGYCDIGTTGCSTPINRWNSRWWYCTIDGSGALGSIITRNAENTFTVKFSTTFGSVCNMNKPCTLFIDSVDIECS